MHLPSDVLSQLENPDLALNERARVCCRIAQHYEQIGDYEAATEALGEFWRGVGIRPNVEGLNEQEQSDVILRVGALTGWIGRADQIEGAQEAAKDLITQSLRLFRAQGRISKVGEARSDLALCYWRAGEYDEARVMLQEAYNEIDQRDFEQRAVTLMRRALVERESKRLNEAVRLHNEAKPLFENINNHLLTAHFHHAYANVLNRLSAGEQREDYIDLALIEYTAASFHFEKARHERCQAYVENNIGYLLGKVGKFRDAHEHLDRAQALMTRLKDNVHLGQVDETRATLLLAENRNLEAEKVARAAVVRLEKGDERSLLVEALTTHGIALARLAHPVPARRVFNRAIGTAEEVADFESAGRTALTFIEEFGNNLSAAEIAALLEHAVSLLEKTDDVSTLRRLGSAAFQGLFVAKPGWKDFSLRQAVRRYEAKLIKAALAESKGSVTHASQLLGFRHHQSLVSLLGTRHKDLTPLRSTPRIRRKHLMVHPKKKKQTTP